MNRLNSFKTDPRPPSYLDRSGWIEPLPNGHRAERSTGKHEPVRVLLVDDSIFALHGLRTFLSQSSNIVIVGTAISDVEALAAIRVSKPDVVVSEIEVGRSSGIDLCRRIRESHPKIRVLFFAAFDDSRFLRSAILAGAQGYLLKTASPQAVVRSIEIVSAGQAIIDRQLTGQVLTWVRDGTWAARRENLEGRSAEDQRLLSFVAAGKTNKEIARELGVSHYVVTTRLQRIYKRLKITRKSGAASYFMQFENGPLRGTNLSH
jgi:two-component system, NarL family, response regulator DevR